VSLFIFFCVESGLRREYRLRLSGKRRVTHPNSHSIRWVCGRVGAERAGKPALEGCVVGFGLGEGLEGKFVDLRGEVRGEEVIVGERLDAVNESVRFDSLRSNNAPWENDRKLKHCPRMCCAP